MPYVIWPVAALVGVIGYNIESFVRRGTQTSVDSKSISDQRNERLLEELQDTDATNVDSLKNHAFVPKTIFDRTRLHRE